MNGAILFLWAMISSPPNISVFIHVRISHTSCSSLE